MDRPMAGCVGYLLWRAMVFVRRARRRRQSRFLLVEQLGLAGRRRVILDEQAIDDDRFAAQPLQPSAKEMRTFVQIITAASNFGHRGIGPSEDRLSEEEIFRPF